MARGGAESPRSQETETSSQSLDPHPLRPNLTLSWRCQGHFSQDHQELLTDRPSSKETTSNHGGSQEATRREIPSWSPSQKMWGPGTNRVMGTGLMSP